ncbi:MAG: hypothetical protein Q8880_02355, partial [Bacteroidota bacterium]|nr:hypothetical protein [Bacteroidota bacterium]
MIRTLKNKLNKVVNKDSYYKKYLENNVGTGYNLKLIGRNYETGKFFPEYEDKIHLKETINWLKKGQDVCNGNGVSSLFCPIKGWGVAYPETSGYIIPTFLAISELINDDELFKRAVKLGDWEIEIQTNSGGVLSNPLKSFTRIFNTGQVILGWCVLYEKTNENKYLNAALRAAEYLLINQEYDGQWNKNTYCGSRTYHSRVDWALLRLGLLSNDKR